MPGQHLHVACKNAVGARLAGECDKRSQNRRKAGFYSASFNFVQNFEV
jgi:hypothetical protein